MRSDPPTSLYVHVPFCVVKCGYCDFNSYTVEDRGVMDVFLDALDRELSQVVLPARPVSVFVGGGTPTYLDEDRFDRLWTILARHVDLRAVDEVSMEANPESVSQAKGERAREAGLTRVSVGAQTFDPGRLAFLDRAHGPERIAEAVGELRAAGIGNLSLDMMFALPGQTAAEWSADLDSVLSLEPDHVSAYALIFEPGTRLTRDQKRGRVSAVDEEVEREMFLETRARMKRAGFEAYEISNFAGRGGPCRHNDHYWLQRDYVGVGPGAASHRAGVRSTNYKPVDAWARAVLDGRPGTATAETLSPRQRFGEALWLGLRRTLGVDLSEIAGRLDWPLPASAAEALERHEAAGLLARRGERVALTEEGVLYADMVGESLLALD